MDNLKSPLKLFRKEILWLYSETKLKFIIKTAYFDLTQVFFITDKYQKCFQFYYYKFQDKFRNRCFNNFTNQTGGGMMKKLFVLAAAITLSTNVFAGNMSENNDMKAMHSKMKDKLSVENILQNEDMQRLHKDMTLNAISEAGMEARLEMMKEEGRSYHKALEKGEKNTAG